MEKINISLKLNNKDLPYEYNGEARVNKDIIEFIDNKDNYIFDKKVKRLIKQNKDNTIIIDFNNEEIIIIEKEKEFKMKIKVKNIKIDNNDIEIVYNVDKNDILLEIKEV